MYEYMPLLIAGAIIGTFAVIFTVAFFSVKDKKTMGYERNMKDREILKYLGGYAKPYWKSFVLVLVVMLVSITYDLVSPLLVGHIEETVKDTFALPYLFSMVAVYAGVLIVSMICTYIQAITLQKTGQKILSALRTDGRISSPTLRASPTIS